MPRGQGGTANILWKTVRGFPATDAGHGLEKAASTEARDVMSALTKSQPAAVSSMSGRFSGEKSTMRMLSAGCPRWSNCRTS